MEVPLVGCTSHRLNLAVKLLMREYEDRLGRIQTLMVNLRTLNQAAKLRFRTHLRPVLRQDTRWSSTFTMLLRFFELKEHLDVDDEVIADLLPSAQETKYLKALLEQLKFVESVSKRIQANDVEVRALFDALTERFSVFERYLAPTAPIVSAPAIEAAIGKLQTGPPLNRDEKQAVASLKVSATSDQHREDGEDGFAERVLKRARVTDAADRYILIAAVLPTSNIVERLFSRARALIGMERHSLQPIMIEAVMFLKYNRSLWDVHTVHDALEGEQ